MLMLRAWKIGEKQRIAATLEKPLSSIDPKMVVEDTTGATDSTKPVKTSLLKRMIGTEKV